MLENEREAEQLQRLRVQIGGAASAYTKAGQFIQVGCMLRGACSGRVGTVGLSHTSIAHEFS